MIQKSSVDVSELHIKACCFLSLQCCLFLVKPATYLFNIYYGITINEVRLNRITDREDGSLWTLHNSALQCLLFFSRSWTMPTSGFSGTGMVGRVTRGQTTLPQSMLRSEWTTGLLQHPPSLPIMPTCSGRQLLLITQMPMVHNFMLRFASNGHNRC